MVSQSSPPYQDLQADRVTPQVSTTLKRTRSTRWRTRSLRSSGSVATTRSEHDGDREGSLGSFVPVVIPFVFDPALGLLRVCLLSLRSLMVQHVNAVHVKTARCRSPNNSRGTPGSRAGVLSSESATHAASSSSLYKSGGILHTSVGLEKLRHPLRPGTSRFPAAFRSRWDASSVVGTRLRRYG